MFLVDWAVKMRIRPPEFETSICDAKYHVSLASQFDPFADSFGVTRRRDWVRPRCITKAAPPLLSKRRRRRQPCAAAAARCRRKFVSGQLDEENPFVLISSTLLVQPDEGVSVLVVDRIGDNLPQSTEKSRILVIPVGARHKCQQDRKSKFMESMPSAAAARNGPSTARDCARAAARCSRHERARCAAWRVDMREPLRNTAAGSALPCAALGERLWPPRAFLLRTFAPLHSTDLLRAMADDGRRLSCFVSRGRACVALLAARCRLLDAPPGRRCTTLACAMLRPWTPCVTREFFFVWRSPAGRRSGESPAMS
ncbi:hypothetical protein F511_21798 [Dorcoceras hygrometricum]|uniref:Uncharacterized protein n=1 Tax=Dorcoceras hygrometricum TaxID=472368 RepID=A0A2Z7BJT8_9LAMI|nr:hypothetical protein F511_21798 [Dorcoceras hygrometricum]